MATTLRLPEGLMTEAQAYAAQLGLSMNGLVAVALRDYLDSRRMPRSDLPSVASGSSGASSDPSEAQAPGIEGKPPSPPAPAMPPAAPTYNAPKSRSDPCPCGATDRHGQPRKWKHCHERVTPA